MSFSLNATGSHAISVQEAYLIALENADIPQPSEGSSFAINFGADSQRSQGGSASPAVIVSLSPAAMSALSKEQVALQVMTGRTYAPSAASARTEPTSPTIVEPTGGGSVGANASAGSGASLPSVGQIQSMSASDWLYATTNAQDFTAGMGPEQAASFEAAYNAKTLNIQNASDIQQLDYRASWTYSGTATGTGGWDSVSMNSAWAAQQYGPNCIVSSDPLYGGILVSWGAQSPTGSGAASTAAPNGTASAA